jgi:hypothetical protein
MKMNKDNKKNMPNTPGEWITEIAEAYYDAYEAIPFGLLTGQKITENKLFHMSPHICLKFRGIERTIKNVNRATEAMLSSHVATEDQTYGSLSNPYVSFGFGYLASHFAMALLSEEKVAEIMEYIEKHHKELKTAIKQKINKKSF